MVVNARARFLQQQFLNLSQGGTDTSLFSGIMLKANHTSVECIKFIERCNDFSFEFCVLGDLAYYAALMYNVDLISLLFPFSSALKNSSFLFIRVKNAVNSASFTLTVQSVQHLFSGNQGLLIFGDGVTVSYMK